MKALFPIAVVIAITSSSAAVASDDCHRPMAEWQSRESVTAHVKERGITTERLRIDDGCYEVRGRDAEGNQVEMKLDPASLAILELEVRFRPGVDSSRYLPARSQAGALSAAPTGKLHRAPNTPVTTGSR